MESVAGNSSLIDWMNALIAFWRNPPRIFRRSPAYILTKALRSSVASEWKPGLWRLVEHFCFIRWKFKWRISRVSVQTQGSTIEWSPIPKRKYSRWTYTWRLYLGFVWELRVISLRRDNSRLLMTPLSSDLLRSKMLPIVAKRLSWSSGDKWWYRSTRVSVTVTRYSGVTPKQKSKVLPSALNWAISRWLSIKADGWAPSLMGTDRTYIMNTQPSHGRSQNNLCSYPETGENYRCLVWFRQISVMNVVHVTELHVPVGAPRQCLSCNRGRNSNHEGRIVRERWWGC